ncbi:antibiotic biosynthesis monooxygenase [Hankyongella ginsenosidimutans]|uniref:Antibiotic biosynthesis monooxygenase n=1 Tax=Hankyongella ginsenosidimutans TaxID=1763828 RepID=A0A4D7CBT7_9SPHN|nr:putative quinol monooxygenase [Hankyongella ginsenosidimutans]QCI79122.1 antibiotic biosynthesis monooxygenase [Hankyongella ginsenosidimutans]
MSDPLIVFARIKAKDGKADALGAALRSIVTPSRAEPGCLSYVLHRAIEAPNIWIVYETWESPAALNHHFEQPYMVALLNQVPNLVEGNVELTMAAIVE